MPRIAYRHPDGSTEASDVPAGVSVMRGAVSNGVKGILAECGGAAMCATCHVYVDASFRSVLPPVHEVEDEMLHGTSCPRRDTSRLSCQLEVTPDMDGLIVELPETQE